MNLPRIRDKYREIKTEHQEIKENEVLEILGKIKGKKSTGLDGIKPEMYKELGSSKIGIEVLCKGYNKILEEGGGTSRMEEI